MRIVIAGDFCPKDRVAKLIDENQYSQIFGEVKNYTSNCDYSIVNLECPVFDGELSPIDKCGPNLKASSKTIEALKYAGFDCVTLANNHFRDFGCQGVRETIKHLQANNIDFVGGGLNLSEAQNILYKTIDNKRVAFINVCENESSIAQDSQAGSAPLDIVDNVYQINQARKDADYVIVIVHGGHEYFQYPSPRMKKVYRFFVDMGADAVINHHQHCYSGYEIYNNKPIFYGLGNFCFDWVGKRKSIWHEGYMVILEIKDNHINFELVPYSQCDDNPTVTVLNDSQRRAFNDNIERMCSVIGDDEQLKAMHKTFIQSRYNQIIGVFASYHNRYLNAAASRGWLPRMITKQEIATMLNYVNCEAHRDLVISVLSDELSKR